jgi:outer membrane protein TolC
MRLTFLGNRMVLATAVVTAGAAFTGCQRLPYIDQTKAVPHDVQGTVADEDKEVQAANFLSRLPTQLPQIDKPRTPDNPDAQEVWKLTLDEAIRIGLDNAEIIRLIPLGAQGIPSVGFEPTPLEQGIGAPGQLGGGNLASVYDPAIQETNIAQALAAFDANLFSQLTWGRSTSPFNNAIQAGIFNPGARFPVVFTQDTATYTAGLSKRTATGAVLAVEHNINWIYSNNPNNVFPSAYTANTQLMIRQPLLGGAVQTNGARPPGITGLVTGASGLEANRAPIVIARLQADTSVWRFKADIMRLVRSVEQQYWALAQQQVQYWSREQAVRLGESILRREQAKFEVGSGSIPNVAEAEQNLREFQLELVQATADLITTERQLRNVLGLKPTDNRRIVPVTAPTEARLEPDWDTSLAQMVSFQPDIVQNQLLVRVAELNLLIARNQLLPQLDFEALYQFNGLGRDLDRAEAVMTGAALRGIDPRTAQLQRNAGLNPQPGLFGNFQTYQVGLTFQMPLGFRGPLANTRQAQYQLLRQRAGLQQVVHQSTHSLARFFLEVDANYKLLKYAGLSREAAERRLAAQRAFFEQGTINIDRYLEAVRNWANAVAREAQFKTTYNISIAALEEAKGTLLAYDNIAVAEGPHPRKAYLQAHDQQAAHRQLRVPQDGPYRPAPITGPPGPDWTPPVPTPGEDPPGPGPALPAPAGTLGPAPTPVAPTVPASEHSPLTDRSPKTEEPGTVRTSAPGTAPPPDDLSIDLPPLPRE